MLPYFLMFLFPAAASLVIGSRGIAEDRMPRLGLVAALLVFALLIGLRYQVGTDWFNYQRTVSRLYYTSFRGTLGYKDPGFGLVTWISTRAGYGIYGADMVCGLILMFGIGRFAMRQPDAWLALTAAVPYLIIVVGMGYVRQAAAIGFILLALNAFERHAYVWLGIEMVLAAMFHGTSLVILPIMAVVIMWERPGLLIPLAVLAGALFALLLRERIATFYSTYIDAQYSSSGALIRLFMNAVPAVLFLLLRKRYSDDKTVVLLWTFISLISLALLAIFPVFPSSTALDRFGLYFIPIQMFVFGRLPAVFGGSPAGVRIVSYLTVLYYGAVLFIWLAFASNSHAWVPYQFAPLVTR